MIWYIATLKDTDIQKAWSHGNIDRDEHAQVDSDADITSDPSTDLIGMLIDDDEVDSDGSYGDGDSSISSN